MHFFYFWKRLRFILGTIWITIKKNFSPVLMGKSAQVFFRGMTWHKAVTYLPGDNVFWTRNFQILTCTYFFPCMHSSLRWAIQLFRKTHRQFSSNNYEHVLWPTWEKLSVTAPGIKRDKTLTSQGSKFHSWLAAWLHIFSLGPNVCCDTSTQLETGISEKCFTFLHFTWVHVRMNDDGTRRYRPGKNGTEPLFQPPFLEDKAKKVSKKQNLPQEDRYFISL